MKLLKKIIAMITGVNLLAVTMNFPVFAQGNTTSAQSDFESLLNEYHITVRGASAEISAKELKGIMKTGSPSARIQKINMNTDAPVRLSAKELLELQYYNTEGEMRESFLSEARNSVIDVELVRGKTTWGIGSSFTPYEDPDAAAPRKTTNISYKKTENLKYIKTQDLVGECKILCFIYRAKVRCNQCGQTSCVSVSINDPSIILPHLEQRWAS